MPEEISLDTNFKVIDKRSPETQARKAEMNPKICPHCNSDKGTRVVNTRASGYRRRECKNEECGFRKIYGVPYRFSTEETKKDEGGTTIYSGCK